MTTTGWNGRGSTRAWRQLRDRILINNIRLHDGRCQLHLPGCTGEAVELHHSEPWTGRPEDAPPETLIPCCGSCNKRAGWTPNPTDPEPRPWPT